ncbi:MAG TPA: ABC transporter ATP-binding protein [Candidatus Limnocylindria bacterium]|jgi:NitT/TauT family transport system ATP-binding protein|nr:ABC transporter ATP-binding protein [Candidatus Limnocylindria bacterium]
MKLQARDVVIHHRRQRYGDMLLAVDGATLEVGEGEFVAIVGPSGCGKTTFLNAVDGLIPLTSGSLTLDGKRIERPGHDRGMVFQQPSLLPWRTVTGNVMYGAELLDLPKGEARQRAKRFIDLVGLTGFEESYPLELSGGMQQRANLARALAVDPEVLLLDEPFAALDAQTRETMQQELLRIWNETRKTALFITHDIVEAVYLADRVIVFSARPGRVKEVLKVDVPRPRDLRVKRDPRFLEIETRIWESIREEAARDTLAATA